MFHTVLTFWTVIQQGLGYTGKAVHLRGHDGPINCMVACKPFSIVVTGSADKSCIVWDTNRYVRWGKGLILQDFAKGHSCMCATRVTLLRHIVNSRTEIASYLS